MSYPPFILQPKEKEGKKTNKKNRKFKIQVILKKHILRNTVKATKHKLFEQLKKTEKNRFQIVDSCF